MDVIEELEKLKELKEKGILSESEYDYQKQIIMSKFAKTQNSAEEQNINLKVSTPAHSGINIIWLAIVGVIIYFGVVTAFPKSIECKEGVSEEMCDCIRYNVSQKIPFMEKFRMLMVGASAEEINNYTDLETTFTCALKNL